MWTRLCIDVDDRGDVRGISIERHDGDGPTTVWTTSVGPFDDPHQALETALHERQLRFGTVATLF